MREMEIGREGDTPPSDDAPLGPPNCNVITDDKESHGVLFVLVDRRVMLLGKSEIQDVTSIIPDYPSEC